jgi:hypothetical protein
MPHLPGECRRRVYSVGEGATRLVGQWEGLLLMGKNRKGEEGGKWKNRLDAVIWL